MFHELGLRYHIRKPERQTLSPKVKPLHVTIFEPLHHTFEPSLFFFRAEGDKREDWRQFKNYSSINCKSLKFAKRKLVATLIFNIVILWRRCRRLYTLSNLRTASLEIQMPSLCCGNFILSNAKKPGVLSQLLLFVFSLKNLNKKKPNVTNERPVFNSG